MGSGRTELGKALFGLEPLLKGRSTLYGNSFQPRSPSTSKQNGIGPVPEERAKSIFSNVSVRENVSSASADMVSGYGIVQKAKEMRLVREIVKRLKIRCPSGKRA